MVIQARGRIMMKFADLIDQNVEELAALDTIDACWKAIQSWQSFRHPFGSNLFVTMRVPADKIHGEVLKMSRELQGYTLREPVGVVGHIIPWNFPRFIFFMKASPALAAGCTMVIKPAITAFYENGTIHGIMLLSSTREEMVRSCRSKEALRFFYGYLILLHQYCLPAYTFGLRNFNHMNSDFDFIFCSYPTLLMCSSIYIYIYILTWCPS